MKEAGLQYRVGPPVGLLSGVGLSNTIECNVCAGTILTHDRCMKLAVGGLLPGRRRANALAPVRNPVQIRWTCKLWMQANIWR
jgi:hypothetical protein